MPAVHRQTDATSCPSGPQTWSTDVFANNLGIVRNTDIVLPGGECQGGIYIGLSTVYVNSLAIQVIGSGTSCGHVAVTGSPDIFAELL